MRMFVMLVVAAVVVAIGYGVKTALVSGTASTIGATVAANAMSPHDIHLNYKDKEILPVHETNNAN
jgi:hypothetical protein